MSGGTAIRTKRPCASKYFPFYLFCEKLHHSYSYSWVKSITALTPLTVTSYYPGHSRFEIHTLNPMFINPICVCLPKSDIIRGFDPIQVRVEFLVDKIISVRFLFPVFDFSSVGVILQTTHSHIYLPPSLYCISSWQSYARRHFSSLFVSPCNVNECWTKTIVPFLEKL